MRKLFTINFENRSIMLIGVTTDMDKERKPEELSFGMRLMRLWNRLASRVRGAAGTSLSPEADEAEERRLARTHLTTNAMRELRREQARKLSAEIGEARQEAMFEEMQRLRKILAFYESLVDELPTPIFAKTVKSRYCLFNKAYEQFFGVKRENLLGLTMQEVGHLSEETSQRCKDEEGDIIREGSTRHYETEFATPTGIRQAMYWTKGFGDRAMGTWAQVGMIVDVSEQVYLKRSLAAKVAELKQIQQKLRYLSRSDALTGLANRRPFAEYLSLGIDLARRKQIPMCMLMADIDHFKHINDTYGHDTGDMILKALAGMLRSSCRSKDLAARVGGEEFFVLLAATKLEDAVQVAERIRKNIADTPLLPDGGCITVSIGVARFRPQETTKAFIKRVDAAMYKAKTGGRNQVQVAQG